MIYVKTTTEEGKTLELVSAWHNPEGKDVIILRDPRNFTTHEIPELVTYRYLGSYEWVEVPREVFISLAIAYHQEAWKGFLKMREQGA
jgi:hypothetical protein